MLILTVASGAELAAGRGPVLEPVSLTPASGSGISGILPSSGSVRAGGLSRTMSAAEAGSTRELVSGNSGETLLRSTQQVRLPVESVTSTSSTVVNSAKGRVNDCNSRCQ